MTIALRIIIALAVALGIAKVAFGAERCDLAIQGAGAFVEVAAGAENFAEAMKRKLTMELNLS